MPVPTTETEVTTTETAPKTKKAAKAKAPKGAKKGPPAEKGTKGVSKWYVPILKYLKKHPNGETKAKVKEDLKTQSLSGVLEAYPNLITSAKIEGARGLTYTLTTAGRKEADKV